jgi:hypothetical protein
MARESRKKVKKFEAYEKSRPIQLSLFELLEIADRDYSNSIELYDFIPKYVWGKQERVKVEEANREILKHIKRDFEYRGNLYEIRIKPASIEGEDGVVRDYFPSKREELVEDALRKIACEGGGIFLDEQAGVAFTLYRLRRELEERGHGYKLTEIKEALYILSETHLELTTADGQTVMKANMFQTLGLQTQEDWRGTGQKTRAFARFNPLVTKAIQSMAFRRLNYAKAMSFTNVIARQLFKRMSHHYKQASLSTTYSITLSTIIRDFGLKAYTDTESKKNSHDKKPSQEEEQRKPIHRNNLRDVVKALEEMKARNVVLEYQIEKTLDKQQRGRLLDAKFIITTAPDFNSEMMKANQKAKEKVLPSALLPEALRNKL